MKMSFFEYQMTKLDHLVLEMNAANENLAMWRLHHLNSISKSKPVPEAASFEDDDLLLDNVPI